jgi:hypothetical protein
MLRLIHAQTIPGAILVDDIDDGLPNKEVYRLGTTADPKAYQRDGAANKPKQNCYVPYSRAAFGFPGIAGYVNLQQTERVTLSAGKGKISKLILPPQHQSTPTPLISVVSLVAADIRASVITAAATVAANFQIDGTSPFTSVTPDTTTVTFTKGTAGTTPSPAVWTQAAIIAAGGSIAATQILIPTAAFVGQVVVPNNLVTVQANEQNSNTFTST